MSAGYKMAGRLNPPVPELVQQSAGLLVELFDVTARPERAAEFRAIIPDPPPR